MTPAAQSTPDTQASVSGGRRLLFKSVQWIATVAAFAYLFIIIDWGTMWGALSEVSPSAFIGTCLFYYVALFLGAVRWHLLLRALGAHRPIRLLRLFRLYVIGLFYNTFVPGGVGGDLVRAVASREAFGPAGATSAFAVVFIERAMGLGGMCLVVASATMLFPLQGVPGLAWIGAVGVVLALGGFVGLAFARRIGPHVPGRLSQLLLSLPILSDFRPMPPAVGTAILTHMCSAVAGYLLIAQVAPSVSLAEAMTIVPLSLAAAYLPISIGGAGVVELALVNLLAIVGVAQGPALAAALCLRAAQWAVAAPGGLLALFGDKPADHLPAQPPQS